MVHLAARAGMWTLIAFVLAGAVPMLVGAYASKYHRTRQAIMMRAFDSQIDD